MHFGTSLMLLAERCHRLLIRLNTRSFIIGRSQIAQAALLDIGIGTTLWKPSSTGSIAPCKNRVLLAIDGSVAG